MKSTLLPNSLVIRHLGAFSECQHSECLSDDSFRNNNPPGRLLSATELAQERVTAVRRVFENKWGTDPFQTRQGVSRDVRTILKTDAMNVFNSIPKIWKYRLTTSTCFFQLGENMCYTEIDPSFPDGFDSSDFSDGGVRIKAPIDILDAPNSDKRRLLPIREYLGSKGGIMTPRELYDHRIVRAIIPDDRLRREYMTCLELLDHFSFYNKGKHALWRPGEMKKGFIRWMSLGFKGECIYPPNLMTWLHDMIFRMMYGD